jgi:hypothetical protein
MLIVVIVCNPRRRKEQKEGRRRNVRMELGRRGWRKGRGRRRAGMQEGEGMKAESKRKERVGEGWGCRGRKEEDRGEVKEEGGRRG